MTIPTRATLPSDPVTQPDGPTASEAAEVILSFDVEEHYRIEAAAGLAIDPSLKAHCRERLEPSTRWLLEALGRHGIRATFFIVGQIARHSPGLVRAIHAAGHEVASHGWDHRRVHHFTPASFRADVRQSQDALQQVTGEPVLGYRAPTFSLMRQTAWAIDVLAELGLRYDSSVYPVRHDRYGVPRAPRAPFLARGQHHTLLELPPATLRLSWVNLPLGGGGYFRLFPLFLTRLAVRQTQKHSRPPVVMLYFHPWEFDPDQQRLPLRRLSRFRTYVGISRSRGRLEALLPCHRFSRALDVADRIDRERHALPCFDLTT